MAAGRKDLQGKINYHRQLHRQRQLQERLAKRNKGESLKRKYNQVNFFNKAESEEKVSHENMFRLDYSAYQTTMICR